MKKYNLKRFLASLLAVLMLASVTGVSPAVFAEDAAAPELVTTSKEQPVEVLIKDNYTDEQVLSALATALLTNADAVDAQSLDWTYTCAVKGNYTVLKVPVETKKAREATVSVFGETQKVENDKNTIRRIILQPTPTLLSRTKLTAHTRSTSTTRLCISKRSQS